MFRVRYRRTASGQRVLISELLAKRDLGVDVGCGRPAGGARGDPSEVNEGTGGEPGEEHGYLRSRLAVTPAQELRACRVVKQPARERDAACRRYGDAEYQATA